MKRKQIIRGSLIALAIGLAALAGLEGGALDGNKVPAPPYAASLFDSSYVHSININIDEHDWQHLLNNALEKEYISCSAQIDGEAIANIGIRTKGNNSLEQIHKYGSSRYSLKLKFDHYVDGQYYRGLDQLSLNSSFQDNAYMKDYMAYDMMRFMGVNAPLCSYAYVTVNERDWGLFVAVEEAEKSFAKRNFGSDYGQLYKPDYKRLDAANDDVALIYTGDDLSAYANIFDNAQFKPTNDDKRRLIQSLKQLATGDELEKALDIDRLLSYFVVQGFVVNLDSYLGRTGHNYLLYEKNGILTMLPWDYNLAFGTYMLGVEQPVDDAAIFVNYPIDTPAPGEHMLRRPMYHNLMKYSDSFYKYRQRYGEFITEYFESGYFSEKVDQTAAMIEEYVERDPTKFCSLDDHKLAVRTFSSFCSLRAESVRGQLDGSIPSTFKGQAEDGGGLVDASSIRIQDMGDFEDMRQLRDRLNGEQRGH